MEPSEIVALLESYGFKGLRLLKHENTISTFHVASADAKKMKTLGSYTVAAEGKVAVYELADIARIGYCPSKNAVRFIFKGVKRQRIQKDKITKEVEVSPEILQGFYRAQANPDHRIPFCTKLFHFLNTEKFGGRLPLPKLVVSSTPPSNKFKAANARGVYYGKYDGSGRPIMLWMNSKTFAATEQTFLMIFLHEMCHEATDCIDKISSAAAKVEEGHGEEWKAWMVKVGLDPNRYDYSDVLEYMSSGDRASEKAKLLDTYGPKVNEETFKAMKLIRLSEFPEDENFRAYTDYEGYLAKVGVRPGSSDSLYIFNRKGRIHRVLNSEDLSKMKFYVPK